MPTPVVNIFGSDSFSAASLTKAVVEIPNQFPQIPVAELFQEESVNTTIAQVDFENQEVNLVAKRERGGGKAVKARQSSRGSRFYDIPSRRIEDAIKAADIQNRRRIGVPDLETAENVTIDRLAKMALVLQQTRLYLQFQAMRGILVDPDGDTLYDAFTELGITQKSIDFVLGTSTTNIISKCGEANDAMDENLTGSPAAGKRAFCSPAFFRKLVSHAEVKDAYKFFSSTQDPLRNDVRAGFVHQDIEWINVPHKATVLDALGNVTTKLYVPDGEAILVPTGTDLGSEFLAPADHINFANQDGLPYYAWSDLDVKQGILELVAEYDGLPVWKKPKTLIKLTTSN